MPENVNKFWTRHDIVICGLQCLPQPWFKCIIFNISALNFFNFEKHMTHYLLNVLSV